jgi:hypothetical protein
MNVVRNLQETIYFLFAKIGDDDKIHRGRYRRPGAPVGLRQG